MGFDTIIRKGVKLAEKLTNSLQVPVEIRRWRGGGGYEGEQYEPAIYPQAIIDQRLVDHHTSSGQSIAVKAHVMILEEFPALGTPERIDPIDRRDKVVLPSGVTGPIVEVGGAGTDPLTGRPFTSEFWIGAGVTGVAGR